MPRGDATLRIEDAYIKMGSSWNKIYEQMIRTFGQVGYALYMAARPQTLSGIADSPVGLAAWLLDHNDPDDQPAAAMVAALGRTSSTTGELTRDEILDNMTLYWLTNTGVANEVDAGGHFAAWEQPKILSQELRDASRSLR